MQCSFCGKEMEDRPKRQGTGVFCSIGCADLANEIDRDENNLSEDDELGFGAASDYESDYYEGDEGMPH